MTELLLEGPILIYTDYGCRQRNCI